MKKFFFKRVKKNLMIGFTRRAGRNFFGRKTIFTQSGGSFLRLIKIDFKRIINSPCYLIFIEKDINRTGFLGLVCYEIGLFAYILLPFIKNLNVGVFLKGFSNYFNTNSSTFLFNIPNGNFVHHIEGYPGLGAVYVRSAGTSAFLINNDLYFAYLKMNSGWLLKISKFCICVIGVVSNPTHHIDIIGKAGNSRKLGIRPKVRGVAMNPRDHPHGGGEGTGSPPRAHKTPWGKLTKSPTNKTKKDLIRKRKYKIFLKK